MKVPLTKIPRVGLLLLATGWLAGCLAEPPALPRIFWPPPPRTPQLEFLGTFASRDDFRKTALVKNLDKVLGKPAYDGLRSPAGLFVDGTGKIYVLDTREKNVRIFDLAGEEVEYLFRGALPNFDRPVDAALDGAGNLYVLDQGKHKVLVFSARMYPLRSFGDPERLARPEYLAIDSAAERLYITDAARDCVEVYDLSGKHLFSFGEEGQETGQFSRPRGLAIDAQGNLYIADSGNARIQVFDRGGAFLHLFGDEEAGSLLARPVDLAFDSKGNLHVIDQRSVALVSFAANGEFLFATASSRPTNHLLGLSSPVGIHIDPDDRIIISDRFNHRFSVWQCLYSSYLADHPVTDADLERLTAFSEKLKKEHRKRMSEQGQVLVADREKKKLPTPEIIVRLRTLNGEAIGFPASAIPKVRCPGCGKPVEVAKKHQDEQEKRPENTSTAPPRAESREAKHEHWIPDSQGGTS